MHEILGGKKLNECDKKEFLSIMYAIAENFNATVSKEGVKIRFEALRGYSIEDVRRSCTEVVKSRKYNGMPNVAEIIEKINGGSSEDRAEAAAYEIISQIRKTGSYKRPEFNDPVIKRIFGEGVFRWGDVCAMPEKKLKFFVKDFVSAYKSFERRPDKKQIGGEPRNILELAEGIAEQSSFANRGK
jgi:hypothetical protein